ncbi:hypothetical protein SAMN05444920_105457 [Nonomuraea solani]|uniref:Knr4/Smi1-like domain-containing protein n=1 Tax=Nonomuraea solani TaxID=1144553 RepID=A0A1H6DIN4_9ACTN|nr:SMI1/KNR4 family protein [Nonomuraea solani]SEG85051.1 hypothetical protein SAMN05444920_105457 [Nonomuraea solani]
MLKLLRLALTAAIATAIVVRLRRRARMPGKRPAPPAGEPARRMRTGTLRRWVWVVVAAVVLTAAAALVPLGAEKPGTDRATEARRQAVTAQDRPTHTPTPRTAVINCSPSPRPVTVRPIDPQVRRAVDRQWRRVERWLKANAPLTYRTLRPPGKARTIAIAEAQMGVDFPDDLRASLLRHNGSRGAAGFGFGTGPGTGLGTGPGGAVNLGIREIRDAWRRLCRPDRTQPPAEDWNGRKIPFLRHGGSTEYAAVDSAGRDSGLSSYYALMRAVADALEQGGEFHGQRPAVERGVLRWQ